MVRSHLQRIWPWVTLGAMALAGCGSGGKTSQSGVAPTPDAAAASTTSEAAGDPVARAAEEYAAKVQRAAAPPVAPPPAAATSPSPTLPPPSVQWVNTAPALDKPPLRKLDPTPVVASVTRPAEPSKPTESAKKPQPRPADASTLSQDQLVSALRQRLDKAPASVKPALAAAALAVLDPKYQLGDKELAVLGPEDRQLVLAYQKAFATLGSALTGDTAENRAALQRTAEELADRVGSSRGLTISRASLCTKVNGFGQYTPFDSNTFLAGREHPAIVYAELDYFASRLDEADGQYVVKLRQEIVLYNDSDGLAVWRVKPTEILDRSRNRRRDFFVVQIVNLPARLSVGKYMLKLTVSDENAQAVDETTLPITIVADANLTK